MGLYVDVFWSWEYILITFQYKAGNYRTDSETQYFSMRSNLPISLTFLIQRCELHYES